MLDQVRFKAVAMRMERAARNIVGSGSWRGRPDPVERRDGETFTDFWRRRIDQHTDDSWAGVPMLKFPEDLRVIQHLIWESRPEYVVELGCKWGGSVLWLRDQLRWAASYGRIEGPGKVIGVDLATRHAEILLDGAAPDWREEITLIAADLTTADTAERVRALVPEGARCLVIEDSAHTYEVSSAALRAYSGLVQAGGYFIVEDGHVDLPELHPDGPVRIKQLGVDAVGVQRAIDEFLASPGGRGFSRRPELELYGVTSHPGGWLRRD